MNSYIVKPGGIIEPTTDALEWTRWWKADYRGTKAFADGGRQVAFDEVRGVTISTVFLGLDQGFVSGAPVLFETVVFGGDYTGFKRQYCTIEEARIGHAEAVDMVTNELVPPPETQ